MTLLLGLLIAVAVLLVLDLRFARAPTPRAALAWSATWLGLAVAFGAALTVSRGRTAGLELATAYLVEQSLSVDNLVVMMLVFARYQVPPAAQRRVLAWGIAGVIVLRGAMIVAGTALVAELHVLIYVLGAVLVVASLRLARQLGRADGAPALPADGVRRWVGRLLPITDAYAGDRFTVVRGGVRHATPLLLALLTIELADAVFALDSIPAVLGVTSDRLIVFSSNLLAVLGLRSLYVVLAGLLARLRYLQHGLVAVIGLVGTKMLVGAVWPAPAWLSLALVILVLAAAVAASLLPRPTGVPHVEGS